MRGAFYVIRTRVRSRHRQRQRADLVTRHQGQLKDEFVFEQFDQIEVSRQHQHVAVDTV